MDPINIIIGINIIALFGANLGGAKQGIRTSVGAITEKPSTRLQYAPTLSAAILLLVIVSLFPLGVTLPYTPQNQMLRGICLVLYLAFSWFQIWAYRTLGDNYAQDIVILKKHQLVQKGPFRLIRHPQYLGQIIADLSVTIAVMSFIALPLVLVEIPIMIMRAQLEDKLLLKHFKEQFESYKKKSSFIIPFVW